MGAALAIYARENGDGVMFEPEKVYDEQAQIPDLDQPNDFSEAVDKPKVKTTTKPKSVDKASSHLRIVK